MLTRRVQQLLIAALATSGIALLILEIDRRPDAKSDAHAASPSVSTITLIRAKTAIARGRTIHDEDIQMQPSVGPMLSGAFSHVADASGRIAARDIAPREPLTTANTLPEPDRSQLAVLIPEGMRAVGLRVSDDTAVANFIRPGDRVDVVLVSGPSKARADRDQSFPNAEARTILQNIEVLAVGDSIIGGKKSDAVYRNVTLAVSPRQAAMVALTRSVGTQYLALRAKDDAGDSSAAAAVTTDDLNLMMAERVAEDSAMSPPAGRSVEVIAGSKRSIAIVPVGEQK